jgi:hypothetical protein
LPTISAQISYIFDIIAQIRGRLSTTEKRNRLIVDKLTLPAVGEGAF